MHYSSAIQHENMQLYLLCVCARLCV